MVKTPQQNTRIVSKMSESKVTKINDSTYFLRISEKLGFAISSDEAKMLKESFSKILITKETNG